MILYIECYICQDCTIMMSGMKEEKAVIPQKLAVDLKYYLSNHTEEKKVISLSEKAVFNAVKNHGLSLGLDLNPHALRKWCITFWSRKGDQAMLNFVSRHRTVNLEGRYVAPLTVDEAIEKQRIMEDDLFNS